MATARAATVASAQADPSAAPATASRDRRAWLAGAAGLAGALLLGAPPARAQREFPNRPIRWIVPYPAGGGSDFLTRIVGNQLAIDTGQPVVVENRTGGNTSLGAAEVLRAPADGYSVLSADNGTLVFNPVLYRNLGYNPQRDFAPVTLIGRFPLVLLVGPASGVRDARAFLEDARAYPGKISYASAGTGSPHHLAMELLQRQARLRMLHVPYRGAANAVADVAGGQLQAMMCDLAAAWASSAAAACAHSRSPTACGCRNCPRCRPSPSSASTASRPPRWWAWWRRRARRPRSWRGCSRRSRAPSTTPRCTASSRPMASNRWAARPRSSPPCCIRSPSVGTA